MLTDLLPLFLAGADMLYVNFSDRTAPRGLTIGKDARTSFLGIDEGFSKVNHYGMATDLYRLQVRWIGISLSKYVAVWFVIYANNIRPIFII